ncbi:MAG: DNA gyrase inhibitor YacG [Methylophilaceae bacterium]|nr:DNA gyrase inhibitor YacG [Methylophilaceae bacterium]
MRQVACPQCNRLSEFTPANPYRPFCSERCKLIDLGQWANESYKIPSAKPIDENDDSNDIDKTNLT